MIPFFKSKIQRPITEMRHYFNKILWYFMLLLFSNAVAFQLHWFWKCLCTQSCTARMQDNSPMTEQPLIRCISCKHVQDSYVHWYNWGKSFKWLPQNPKQFISSVSASAVLWCRHLVLRGHWCPHTSSCFCVCSLRKAVMS